MGMRATSRGIHKSKAGSQRRTNFEGRFEAAARRVLRRRGVPESRLEEEVRRLRRITPAMLLPTVEELERTIAELAQPS
jgi:hypothetical protein